MGRLCGSDSFTLAEVDLRKRSSQGICILTGGPWSQKSLQDSGEHVFTVQSGLFESRQ